MRAAGLAGTGIILLLVVATLTLRGDDAAGRATVFWLFAVVWASDTGAYLAGRAIGGPRLAPRVSPAKTWAGAAGGVAAALGASILLGWLMPLAGWVAERPSLAVLAVAGVLGSIVGQMGDLAESALKRRVGADDSGRLIPGHGGILDRGDSFAAAAFALILATVISGGHATLDLFAPDRAAQPRNQCVGRRWRELQPRRGAGEWRGSSPPNRAIGVGAVSAGGSGASSTPTSPSPSQPTMRP